jgi:trimethylamine:corrinoid methyltransferase-like protein
MRELWLPSLMDRRPYNEWEEKQDGARAWALDRANQILATHQATPLDPKTAEELEQIITAVESKSI